MSGEQGPVERSMLDPRRMDATADMLERLGLADAEIDEVIDLFEALRDWQRAAAAHSAASRRAMRLGDTDMRAVRYLMTAAREGRVVTATMLADHLGLSGPAVTKLVARLEAAGHVRRAVHPHDRRAQSITITDAARERASSTVGRDHARRLEAIAELTSEERRAATAALRRLAALPVLEPGDDVPASGQNGVGASGA